MSGRRIAGVAVAAALATGLIVEPGQAAAPAAIERISKSANGGPTNGAPGVADISADGRWVVYASGADNIVTPDQNNAYDIFLVDRRSGRVRNLTAGANGSSDAPRISADGRRVVFVSLADNLAQGSADPAAVTHTFVWTRGSSAIRQVDVDVAGNAPDASSTSPDLSSDGRVVVFTSRATDLLNRAVTPYQHVYRADLDARTITAADDSVNADAEYPSVDADGDRVAFSSQGDVLLWQRGKPVRNLTPTPQLGGQLPSISGNGELVAVQSKDAFVVADQDVYDDVYLLDVRTGKPRLVSRGSDNAAAITAAISDDGKFVTFNADDDLLPGDGNQLTDAYRWSAAKNHLTRLSGNASPGSGFPRPSGNGSLVVYIFEDRLVPGDNNQFRDVFVRRLG